MTIFFNFSLTSYHIHPLQVENCDSNSRLVVDEDDNGKLRLERVDKSVSAGTDFDGLSARGLTLSVSVYYVAVRTIVLSCHGSNLARPFIIHDIIHGLICVPSTPCCGFFGVSPDGNCAYVH